MLCAAFKASETTTSQHLASHASFAHIYLLFAILHVAAFAYTYAIFGVFNMPPFAKRRAPPLFRAPQAPIAASIVIAASYREPGYNVRNAVVRVADKSRYCSSTQ
jgi:hypothetical protein